MYKFDLKTRPLIVITLAAAIIAFALSFKLNSGSGQTYAQLGFAQKSLGLKSEAAKSLNQALALGFENAKVHSELGVLEFELENFTQAEHSFRNAVALEDSGWNNYWLAKSLQRLGRIAEAITYGEKSVQIDPSSSVFLASLALIHNDAQEHQKALDELEKSILLDPNNCAPYNRKALIFSQLGETAQAMREIERAVELIGRRSGSSRDGCLALTTYTKGGVYEFANDTTLAIAEYKKVLEIPATGETAEGISDLRRRAEQKLKDLEELTQK